METTRTFTTEALEDAYWDQEAKRAKDNPFYQIGSGDSLVACEPDPVPRPVFKDGSFADAIRNHRAYQREWQERISRKLDECEVEYSVFKKECELAMEEI